MSNGKGLDWPGVKCIYFPVSSNSSSAQHRVECVSTREEMDHGDRVWGEKGLLKVEAIAETP